MLHDAPLEIENRDEMSLLGLMLGEVLEANLARPDGAALARKLHGALAVRAGGMSVTIRFDRGRVVVSRGLAPDAKARVKGSLDALLQVSLGRGAIRSFLAGEIGVGGSPLFLLKALPLMRTGKRREGSQGA
jgi:hypothetical protein